MTERSSTFSAADAYPTEGSWNDVERIIKDGMKNQAAHGGDAEISQLDSTKAYLAVAEQAFGSKGVPEVIKKIRVVARQCGLNPDLDDKPEGHFKNCTTEEGRKEAKVSKQNVQAALKKIREDLGKYEVMLSTRGAMLHGTDELVFE